MKNILFLLLIANLSSTILLAQNQEWEVHIGQSNRSEGAADLIEFYDGGYYIEGGFGINDDIKGWSVKTDINGNVLWDKVLDHNTDPLYGWAVAQDNLGNRYVTGVIWPVNGWSWPFIVKFNACGEKIWCKILADDILKEGGAIDITISQNNEIIILSNYLSWEQEAQIYLECLNQDGNYLWKQHYAKQEDYPWIDVPVSYDLMEHNNEYYISGYCYWPFPSDTTHFYQRPLFIGIDSLFNEKWILPFYQLDSVFGKAFSSIPLNDTLLMGIGLRRTDGNEANSLLMFYSIGGEDVDFSQIENDQIIPGLFSNYMREVTKISDSVFLVAGFYEPIFSTFYNLVIKTDSASHLINFLLKPNEVGRPYLIKSSDNNYVLASSIKEPNNDYNIILYKIDENLNMVPFDTNQYTYDSLCPEQIQSGTIDLSDCFIWTGTEEIPTPAQYYARIKTIPVTVYPNPATDKVHFKLENTEHNKNILLKCFNLLGREVYQTPIIPGQKEASADVSGWQQGMYLVVVYSEGRVVGKAKVAVWR